ncbi:MAG: rhodanese-like domain-containing protein [Phycisphaerales bacterium]|nr:rhodanese-like domain-containing protein [Phycisphaerales bacterium]
MLVKRRLLFVVLSQKHMQHNPKFLSRVDQARRAICECTVDELIQAKNEGKSFTLIDVREEREFAAGHIPGAIHMSKGVIERDIESSIPDQDERLVLYCGGGYRSAIAAESLVAMGYTNVISMDGGWRGWRDAEQPVER